MPPIPTLVLIAIVLLVGIPTILAMIKVETRPLGGEARSGRIEIWRPNEPAAVFDGELIGFAKHT